MADIARRVIRERYCNVSVKIDAFKASEQEAFGNGTGIV